MSLYLYLTCFLDFTKAYKILCNQVKKPFLPRLLTNEQIAKCGELFNKIARGQVIAAKRCGKWKRELEPENVTGKRKRSSGFQRFGYETGYEETPTKRAAATTTTSITKRRRTSAPPKQQTPTTTVAKPKGTLIIYCNNFVGRDSSEIVHLGNDVNKLTNLIKVQKVHIDGLTAQLKTANDKIDGLVNRVAILEGKFEERSRAESGPPSATMYTPQVQQQKRRTPASRGPHPRSAQSFYSGIHEEEEEATVSTPSMVAAMMQKMDQQSALMLELSRQRSPPLLGAVEPHLLHRTAPYHTSADTTPSRRGVYRVEEGRTATPPRQAGLDYRRPAREEWYREQGEPTTRISGTPEQPRLSRSIPLIQPQEYRRSPARYEDIYRSRGGEQSGR